MQQLYIKTRLHSIGTQFLKGCYRMHLANIFFQTVLKL